MCTTHSLPTFLSAVDATYELSGKHTYLPMGITAGTYVVTLAIFVAFYKQLTPRVYVTQRGDVEESQPTSSVISLSTFVDYIIIL